MQAQRVAVVGCGTAGAAAALFLARAGHAVTVFERVAEPLPIGAGIVVQPTGQAVLARLGLLAPIIARGARIDRLWLTSARGRTIVDLPYAAVAGDLVGLGLHRGVLFATLFAAVRAEPRIDLRLGVAIDALARAGDGRWLGAGDVRFGPFDLVVAADGSASALHRHTAIPHRIRPYPWGALWFVARDPDGQRPGMLRQWVDGARHLFGILPTGLGPDGDQPVVSLFWSIRADRVPAWRDAGLEPWKRAVRRFDPAADRVLDQIGSSKQVLFTQYRDVAMRRWHDDGLVFLGDAAHATSPQLGQGANLALWDAMTLADVLAPAASVAAGLAAYTRARRRHLAYYQFATRALTPFFQGDSRALGFLRDALFPLCRILPPLRRRMVRTMSGLDRGILRRPIGLGEIRGLLGAGSGA